MSDLELELNTPEDETVPTIMLIDEDGKEEAHQVLAWQEYEGREFAVLCPVDIEDGAEVGLVIMEIFFLKTRRPPRSTRTPTSFPTRLSSDLSAEEE